MIDITKAAELIKRGEVVAFPTETVYGLGADATIDSACLKIYALKGRPSNNPLIVHVASLEQAMAIGEFSELACKVAENFWPGPLTIVVKRKSDSHICDTVSAGLDTIGIRVPSHEAALELITKADRPIAAPSANISNYVSPTEVSHVKEAFGDKLYVLEGEKAVYGLESTIIDMSDVQPTILRYGFITPEAIEAVIGIPVRTQTSRKILAPGMMAKHYSPNAKVTMNATTAAKHELGLGFGSNDIGELNLSKTGDLAEAASNLYAMLRLLDKMAAKDEIIAVAPIPETGIGLAINDRLKRAVYTKAQN